VSEVSTADAAPSKPITGGVGVANNTSTSAFGNAIVLKAGA
jgi:hypothetical protein